MLSITFYILKQTYRKIIPDSHMCTHLLSALSINSFLDFLLAKEKGKLYLKNSTYFCNVSIFEELLSRLHMYVSESLNILYTHRKILLNCPNEMIFIT